MNFVPGDEVLIIQMSGTHAGQYEFATVKEVNKSSLRLQEGLRNIYVADASSVVQIIRVPHYRTVSGEGTITAKPWDGQTGGVIVFRAVEVSGITVVTGMIPLKLVAEGNLELRGNLPTDQEDVADLPTEEEGGPVR